MKKLVVLAISVLFCMTTFSQSLTLSNGDFENGNFEKMNKNAVGAENWYWNAGNSKVAGSTIELSTTEKHKGNKSVKFTASGDIPARYFVMLTKKLGTISKLNYTFTFWAKSNIEVKLNCNFDGSCLKEGVSTNSGTPGDVIKILGNNKWEKYTLVLKGKVFSNVTSFDFTKPANFNVGLEKQTISGNLELYIDDLELLD